MHGTGMISGRTAGVGVAVVVALMAGLCSPVQAGSPASDGQHAISSLSPDEIASYLSGQGMGFAKVAEVNGYPGPSHVLELAAQLQLNSEQRDRTQALFDAMRAKASALGRALVSEERALDQRFASKTIDAASLAESLERIGQLQAQIRGAHLETHLAQMDVLTEAQVARYRQLRGHGESATHGGHGHH